MKMFYMGEKNKNFFDPGFVFQTPEEVLKRKDLSREQKIKILCDGEDDIRELAVAEEENMKGAPSEQLAEMPAQIHRAFYYLKARHDAERSSATKHSGGSRQ